jgi:hypothetical protein
VPYPDREEPAGSVLGSVYEGGLAWSVHEYETDSFSSGVGDTDELYLEWNEGCEFVTACEDTNDGETDLYGNTCSDYGWDSCDAGLDTESFVVAEMCCVCGGGTTGAATAPTDTD